MDKKLQDELDSFIEDFLQVPEVKQYLLLKKQIQESGEISSLEKELRASQKEMALSLGKDDYQEKKEKYLSLKKSYENNPLIVNYNVLQEEVEYLLEELKNKLK